MCPRRNQRIYAQCSLVGSVLSIFPHCWSWTRPCPRHTGAVSVDAAARAEGGAGGKLEENCPSLFVFHEDRPKPPGGPVGTEGWIGSRPGTIKQGAALKVGTGSQPVAWW